MELMVNSALLLKIGKLNFSEEIMGQIYHPDIYKKVPQVPAEEEIEEKKSPLAEDPVPADLREKMSNLADL